jgi:hypothetical protein
MYSEDELLISEITINPTLTQRVAVNFYQFQLSSAPVLQIAAHLPINA